MLLPSFQFRHSLQNLLIRKLFEVVLSSFHQCPFQTFLQRADYLACNDYEAQLLQEKTGESMERLARGVKAAVVTLGSQGSVIYADGKRHEIPCVKASDVVDPTGCGDAYRAGLLHGIQCGMDWETTGRLASLMGSIKIAHRGGQNHPLSREEIGQRYKAVFGTAIW